MCEKSSLLCTVTLGSDPELSFNGSASTYYTDPGHRSPFGLDGHAATAELRPTPSRCPTCVVNHIQELLRHPPKGIPPTEYWRAGTRYAGRPLGGHIHFGMPVTPTFLSALRHFLAIPVVAIERDHGARGSYGKIGCGGEYETKPYGFEYRSLPSFLLGRGTSLAVFHLAAAIANTLHAQGAVFTSAYFNQFGARFYSRDGGSDGINYTDPKIISLIWDELRTWPEVKRRWHYISHLYWIWKHKGKWDDSTDLLIKWRIKQRRIASALPGSYGAGRLGRRLASRYESMTIRKKGPGIMALVRERLAEWTRLSQPVRLRESVTVREGPLPSPGSIQAQMRARNAAASYPASFEGPTLSNLVVNDMMSSTVYGTGTNIAIGTGDAPSGGTP